MDNKLEVGKRIKEQRLTQKLTREALSERADISVQFLADIESGRKSMTIDTLRKLSLALCVSADYIIFGSNSECTELHELSELFSSLTSLQRANLMEIARLYKSALHEEICL